MKNFKEETIKQLHRTLFIFMNKAFVLLKNEYGHLIQTDEMRYVKQIFESALSGRQNYFEKSLSDMAFIFEKDPALSDKEEREVVIYKSLPLLLLHRIAHDIYMQKSPALGRFISEVNRQLNQAEIHPGATIGDEIFIDHPTGLIIGETAIVGKRFQSFGQVLLGNNAKQLDGRRHPKIADNVTIYPHTVVLGPVIVGQNAVIGGGSTITQDVPANAVALGVDMLSRITGQRLDMPLKDYWVMTRTD